MKGKDSTQNKGYAFVTYRNKELATKAIKELNNTELKVHKILVFSTGSVLICCLSSCLV